MMARGRSGIPGSRHQLHEDTRIPKQTWIVLITTILGWTVTTLDLQQSAFVQAQIAPSLGVSSTFVGNAFFIYSVGLGLGALLLGYFSDLWIGRRRAFMYGILGVIIATGLTGFTQNAWQFVLVRFVAGFFSGGEWILGLLILSEVAPQRYRSRMLAATQAGVGFGYALANLFASTFAAPDAAGWRAAYWASFGFAAVTYVIRLKVEESPYWQRAVAQTKDHNRRLRDVRENVRDLFHGKQRRYTLLALIVFLAIGEPQGTWDFLYPVWYQTKVGGGAFSGLDITYAFEAAIFIFTIGGGWFMDRVSTRWVLPVVWTSVPFLIAIPLVAGVKSFSTQAVILFFAAGGRQVAWAVVAAYFAILFPTRLRGTGMGITWVGGWLLGYTASAWWGPHLQASAGWNTWWIVEIALVALIPIPMIVAGIETRGKPLDFQEQDKPLDFQEQEA